VLVVRGNKMSDYITETGINRILRPYEKVEQNRNRVENMDMGALLYESPEFGDAVLSLGEFEGNMLWGRLLDSYLQNRSFDVFLNVRWPVDMKSDTRGVLDACQQFINDGGLNYKAARAVGLVAGKIEANKKMLNLVKDILGNFPSQAYIHVPQRIGFFVEKLKRLCSSYALMAEAHRGATVGLDDQPSESMKELAEEIKAVKDQLNAIGRRLKEIDRVKRQIAYFERKRSEDLHLIRYVAAKHPSSDLTAEQFKLEKLDKVLLEQALYSIDNRLYPVEVLKRIYGSSHNDIVSMRADFVERLRVMNERILVLDRRIKYADKVIQGITARMKHRSDALKMWRKMELRLGDFNSFHYTYDKWFRMAYAKMDDETNMRKIKVEAQKKLLNVNDSHIVNINRVASLLQKLREFSQGNTDVEDVSVDRVIRFMEDMLQVEEGIKEYLDFVEQTNSLAMLPGPGALEPGASAYKITYQDALDAHKSKVLKYNVNKRRGKKKAPKSANGAGACQLPSGQPTGGGRTKRDVGGYGSCFSLEDQKKSSVEQNPEDGVMAFKDAGVIEDIFEDKIGFVEVDICLLYTSPSPRDH
jgi:hypothetical protein